jgi:hypothetical protein
LNAASEGTAGKILKEGESLSVNSFRHLSGRYWRVEHEVKKLYALFIFSVVVALAPRLATPKASLYRRSQASTSLPFRARSQFAPTLTSKKLPVL